MAWWHRISKPKRPETLYGMQYRVAFSLYSADGKRCADVLEFRHGETYLLEKEWVEGETFKDRHGGSPVGPFASKSDAERFIVATPWFVGKDA